jgi:hypothetical protein
LGLCAGKFAADLLVSNFAAGGIGARQQITTSRRCAACQNKPKCRLIRSLIVLYIMRIFQSISSPQEVVSLTETGSFSRKSPASHHASGVISPAQLMFSISINAPWSAANQYLPSLYIQNRPAATAHIKWCWVPENCAF